MTFAKISAFAIPQNTNPVSLSSFSCSVMRSESGALSAWTESLHSSHSRELKKQWPGSAYDNTAVQSAMMKKIPELTQCMKPKTPFYPNRIMSS